MSVPRIQTRKVALAQGATTYVGGVCAKHSGLEGKRNTNDGSCIECGRLRHSRWKANNPEVFKASQRKWYSKNRDEQVARCKRYKDANPELMKESYRSYGAANKDKINAKTSRRKATKLNATPAWANEFFMKEAYHLAKLREKVLGGKWHVDHIVPLRSKLVCGLHVENNLQVILAGSNLSKSNRYWPQMPA
jgi:hypothetical protein